MLSAFRQWQKAEPGNCVPARAANAAAACLADAFVHLQLRENMPRLVEAVESAGQTVTWVCDPMHGNTESVAGYKTRRYERIRQEVRPSPASPQSPKGSSPARDAVTCAAQRARRDLPGHAEDHV